MVRKRTRPRRRCYDSEENESDSDVDFESPPASPAPKKYSLRQRKRPVFVDDFEYDDDGEEIVKQSDDDEYNVEDDLDLHDMLFKRSLHVNGTDFLEEEEEVEDDQDLIDFEDVIRADVVVNKHHIDYDNAINRTEIKAQAIPEVEEPVKKKKKTGKLKQEAIESEQDSMTNIEVEPQFELSANDTDANNDEVNDTEVTNDGINNDEVVNNEEHNDETDTAEISNGDVNNTEVNDVQVNTVEANQEQPADYQLSEEDFAAIDPSRLLQQEIVVDDQKENEIVAEKNIVSFLPNKPVVTVPPRVLPSQNYIPQGTWDDSDDSDFGSRSDLRKRRKNQKLPSIVNVRSCVNDPNYQSDEDDVIIVEENQTEVIVLDDD